MPVTTADLRAILSNLPAVEESIAYSTPIFKVGKTMLARLRDDGVLVLKVDLMTRDVLLDTNPDAFFLEDHYRGHPLVLVNLAAVKEDRLSPLLAASWRMVAPKRLVREYSQECGAGIHR